MTAPQHSVRLPRDASAFAVYIERTRQGLHARLAAAPGGALLQRYFKRGKCIRAFVLFASASAVGGDPDAVVPAAEAIELLHGASLFHDDIIDHASERRGLPSLHKRLGVGRALVVGDELLLRAFAALSELRRSHPPAQLLEGMDTLNALARECCRGQFEELSVERGVSEEQYLTIVAGKTGAPFVASAVLGVLFAGGTASQRAQIRSYARNLGIAFQIEDDLMDLIGDPRQLGKPVGNSLAEGRPTLPLIYLSRASSAHARRIVRRLVAGGVSRAELADFLERNGILARVRRLQHAHAQSAIASLTDFPEGRGVNALRALAARVTVEPRIERRATRATCAVRSERPL